MQLLGQLNEVAKRVPDTKRFIKAYIIKEALLSSAIEGIHTTILEVFTQPFTESKPTKETRLVINYLQSLEEACSFLQNNSSSISSNMLLAAHKKMLSLGSIDEGMPGRYRDRAVRIGDLIPPPAEMVPKMMADLEQYLNSASNIPPLIQAGLAHVQFETIHPFLDGNGRIGRLLIILLMLRDNLLEMPLLYPSYYFKKYDFEYYHQLNSVRVNGDFEGWIIYFLHAIKASCKDAYKRARDIELLETTCTLIIQNDQRFSTTQETALAALNVFFQTPVITVNELCQRIDKSYNTAHKNILQFIECGLVSENTQQKRNKLYQFDPYLKLLEKEY